MPLLSALAAQGYETPTPIQTQAIPALLEGKDVVGLAQTGTGKTAAFTLPLIQRLDDAGGVRSPLPRILILSPTRELAAQIHKSVRDYSAGMKLRSTCVTGGVSPFSQRKALTQGVAVLVATPGRLLDLEESGDLDLSQVEAVVLDEADHMLDIGFLPAVRRIMALCPARKQTLLFSATMPKEIRQLSARYLNDPVEIAVVPQSSTAERVTQSVMHVNQADKPGILSAIALRHPGARIIVFTRTKRGADKVVKRLDLDGLGAAAIHGNKSQPQRKKALQAFTDGSCPILIATDIAARGIDVPGVELVINLDLPDVPETYVHRIGRTARAGADGRAISLCSADDKGNLRAIERLIRQPIAVADAPAIADLPRPIRQAAVGAPAEKAKADTRGASESAPGSTNSRRRQKRGRKPGANAASRPATRTPGEGGGKTAASGSKRSNGPAFGNDTGHGNGKPKGGRKNGPRRNRRGKRPATMNRDSGAFHAQA